MADRIMVWHIPTLPAVTPVYYADKDYEPVALRIYATRAPGEDLKLDILDDGVSIMNSPVLQTMTFRADKAYIEYGTLAVSTFQVGETVSGASGASAKVFSTRPGGLVLIEPNSTAFVVAETITGATSNATAVVHAYVKQRYEYTPGTTPGEVRVMLRKNVNSEEAAQDFKQGTMIDEGSWVSLSLLDAAGAGNITVQLELDALSVNKESRRWAE